MTNKPSNTVDKIKLQREIIKTLGVQNIEQADDYKMALNAITASENGKLVFKTLIKALGVHSPERGGDLAALIRISEKKNVYLDLIRPFLETSIRQEIEN